MVCDFCSDENPRWLFPAPDIMYTELRAASEGDWTACDTCRGFIEAGEREKLTAHCAERFSKKYDIPEYFFRPEIARMHSRFFAHRHGEARRLSGKVG